MGRTSFESFGEFADRELSWSQIAGRYDFQKAVELEIVRDIAEKLQLSEGDTLLEVGCGAGNLLIPLSGLVNSAAAYRSSELVAEA